MTMTSHVDNVRLQTFSGELVNPLTMSASDVNIVDIAHALSNMCRFTGHTKRFYSVAEHSLHVWATVFHVFGGNRRDGLYALLHDATEAYLVDLPRPLKVLPQFAWYREAESRLQRVIYAAFGLDPDGEPEIVKLSDYALRGIEARDLMGAQVGNVYWAEALAYIPGVSHTCITMPQFADVRDMYLSVTERAVRQQRSEESPSHTPPHIFSWQGPAGTTKLDQQYCQRIGENFELIGREREESGPC